MNTLLGKTYEEFTTIFQAQPAKQFYHVGNQEDFSVFVDGNEYLFRGGRLFSIEISNFSVTQRIPGFAFPVRDGLEESISELELSQLSWEVDPKYAREHWIVLRLPEHDLLYEFEFEDRRFQLQFIRLESPGNF